VTWSETPERPRRLRAWVIEIIYGLLALGVIFVGPCLFLLALLLLDTATYVALCTAVIIVTLSLIRTVDRAWFPYVLATELAVFEFGMLLFGVASDTPLPSEAMAAVFGGIIFGLSSGSTGSIAERNLTLINARSTELRWAALTLVAVSALFGVIVPRFPSWISVAIGGALVVSGLALTWRAPKVGSPHIAIAMMTAAGVAGCILPFVDMVDSPLLFGAIAWIVVSAYREADLRRDERITGRKRWRHPATARAAAFRDAGADWGETLMTLQQEGFAIGDRVAAVRKLDGLNHHEAARLVKFYRHPASTQPT